jgi:hypothetical protein
MNRQSTRWLLVVPFAVVLIVTGTVLANDPLDGAKGFDAIGVGQFTPGACLTKFTMGGTLRGEPVGNAQYTLTVGNPVGACTPPNSPATGALTLTANDHSVLAMDVSVLTPDGGETYWGTSSAPNNLAGPNGAGLTSASSTGKFTSVFG